MAVISTKLEQVSGEKREIQYLYQKMQKEHDLWEDENERVRMDSDKLTKERDNLRTESVRLKHRISYLEEQVGCSLGSHLLRYLCLSPLEKCEYVPA